MIPVLLCFLRMFWSYQIHVYGTQIYFLNHCISIIFLLCKPGCIQCTYMYRCVWVCILLIFYRVTHISCPSNRVSYIGWSAKDYGQPYIFLLSVNQKGIEWYDTNLPRTYPLIFLFWFSQIHMTTLYIRRSVSIFEQVTQLNMFCQA